MRTSSKLVKDYEELKYLEGQGKLSFVGKRELDVLEYYLSENKIKKYS